MTEELKRIRCCSKRIMRRHPAADSSGIPARHQNTPIFAALQRWQSYCGTTYMSVQRAGFRLAIPLHQTGLLQTWDCRFRRPSGYHAAMCLCPGMGFSFAALLLFALPSAQALRASDARTGNLSLTQIVARMQFRNQLRDEQLPPYHSLRSYSVAYHGLGSMSAQMQVEVTYDALHGKSFHIVSQNGSVLLRDAVLKRAVNSEEEASKDKGSTALSPANYRFGLMGNDNIDGRPVYVLSVDPLKPEKFLYRGTVWVDAENFGVVKIQASPAKNPSMWISGATIWVTNQLADGFWLPKETRSQTRVRLGGTATLTIQYGQYQFDRPKPATP
jgi:hypothetical protein